MFWWHLSLRDVTGVGYDMCTYTDFHDALQKYPSREIDDFDVILFQIYQDIGEPRTILIYEALAKLLQK